MFRGQMRSVQVVREFNMLSRLFTLWGDVPLALPMPIPITILDPSSIPIAVGACVSVK
jgi:hypothetical protein